MLGGARGDPPFTFKRGLILKALSLYSGAGGMDVGAIHAGINVVAASEIDNYASQTYVINHPSTKMFNGDVSQNISEIVNYSKYDVVFGGPPCQGFSVAGKQNIDDPRSKEVDNFCRLVTLANPSIVVMENVKNFYKSPKFQHFRQKVVETLNGLGYYTHLLLLNAKDFGVPQSRERVFVVGLKSKNFNAQSLDEFKSNGVNLRNAIKHLGPVGSINNPHRNNVKIVPAKNPILHGSPYTGMFFNGRGRVLNLDRVSCTIPASGGNHTPIIDDGWLYAGYGSWVEGYYSDLKRGKVQPIPGFIRRMTIDEAKLVQTFPQTYKFVGSQTQIFKQIGNAVPCKLAQALFSALLKETL